MFLATARIVLIAALFAVACTPEDTSLPEPTSIEDTSFASSLNVNLLSSTRLPSGMYIRDIAVGGGAPVAGGQTLSMRYTGWLSNGTQFDATGNGAPFTFRLGAGQVIGGWDQGVAGMKVGGTRQLVIPPELGYGSRGTGPIPGNAILVFTVEVVSAQ